MAKNQIEAQSPKSKCGVYYDAGVSFNGQEVRVIRNFSGVFLLRRRDIFIILNYTNEAPADHSFCAPFLDLDDVDKLISFSNSPVKDEFREWIKKIFLSAKGQKRKGN